MSLSNEKFLPLRNMEAFTEDMFNRIIAFQEKQHPAWSEDTSFELRIKGLPLHNFIFSNPDRDPQVFGPTVAHYYPLREEIQRLAHYILQLGETSKTCDIYPGNGLIGSLLAREGVSVTGLSGNINKPCQIGHLFDPQSYTFSKQPLERQGCDVVFASWVPAGENPTATLLKIAPKMLIFVYTDHVNEASGVRQTGSAEMISDIPRQYRLLDEWSITRPKNLLHDIWPDMTPNIEETRITRIYVQASQPDLLPYQPATEINKYDWERELEMALLAREAKHLLESHGVMV